MKKLFLIFRTFFNIIYYFLYGGVKYARRIGVTVGENCRIYTREFGSEPFLIRIGNDVKIAAGASIITHDGSGSVVFDEKGRRYYYAPVSIGNNVMIGQNVIILPGVKIEDNVIIAAGSVVTKSIPENSIVAGVPAKVIGDFNGFREKAFKSWVAHNEIDFSLPYKKRIKSIVDMNYKPFMKC